MDEPAQITWLREQLLTDHNWIYAQPGSNPLRRTGTPDNPNRPPSDLSRLADDNAVSRELLKWHHHHIRRTSDGPQVICAACGHVSNDPMWTCATVKLLAMPHKGRAGWDERWWNV